jgi:hypothetical protein
MSYSKLKSSNLGTPIKQEFDYDQKKDNVEPLFGMPNKAFVQNKNNIYYSEHKRITDQKRMS